MSHLGYLRAQDRLAQQRASRNRKKNQMSQFAQFVAPEQSDGDRFIPRDNIGHVVVIKPAEHKTGIVTSNSANGTDAISADVIDLDATDGPAVYRDTLLFGGAFVDALKNYLGQLVVVKIESRTSKSGRTYAVPTAVEQTDSKRAEDLFSKGDPFAQEIKTVSAAPPF